MNNHIPRRVRPYVIFISHSDEELAYRTKIEIENYAESNLPRRLAPSGVKAIVAERTETPGEDLRVKLEKMIQASSGIVVALLTKSVTKSKCVPWEIKRAQKFDKKVIPFVEYLSIDAKFAQELDKGIISEELRNIFKTGDFPLSENATVRKEKDEWVIKKDGEKIYTIKKGDGKLNIYEEPKYTIAVGLPETIEWHPLDKNNLSHIAEHVVKEIKQGIPGLHSLKGWRPGTIIKKIKILKRFKKRNAENDAWYWLQQHGIDS